ncbi:hypothetical protein [Burkholderia plantarii]|uniref:hypothetical protein n=1 Tax=Burkholderia plantarii TaxID=41899 RepID=UPI0018DC456B|nr:hypothetical protein [Burkholderia plantarii]MBI0330898.1 hypothetical protein [Burkholderia plantarii]
MPERAGVRPSIRDAAFAIDSIWQSHESFNRAGQDLRKKIDFFGRSAILGKETRERCLVMAGQAGIGAGSRRGG